MLPPFSYVRAQNLSDAVDRLNKEGAAAHAGGTDLLGCLRDEVFEVDTLVSLQGLPDLAGVRETEAGGLVIGALTTITEIAEHPGIQARFAALSQAAAEVASPQLRNQGTLGGNLCQKPRCWYYRGDFHCLRKGGFKCYAVNGENQYHCIFGGANCFIVHPSDPAAALVALEAEVKTAGPQGGRRIPVAQLHMPPETNPTRETILEPGELITEIRVPPPAAQSYSSYRKIRTRRAWDFAIAGCALAIDRDGDSVRDCRVVLSGAAPVPWRSKAAEDALRGNVLNGDTIEEAATAALAGAQPMTKNAYKVPLFRGMLVEELQKAARS